MSALLRSRVKPPTRGETCGFRVYDRKLVYVEGPCESAVVAGLREMSVNQNIRQG